MGWGGEATGLPHTIGARDVRDGRRSKGVKEVQTARMDGRNVRGGRKVG
jgi:hypothetical protein